MTLDKLQAAKITAMKNNNAVAKNALSGMIDAIQKAAITPKGRVEITERLTDETLIKYQKSIQEQVDTCPETRVDLLDKYRAELAIVKMYAPQLLTDKEAIRAKVNEVLAAGGITPVKASHGAAMKLLSAELKGKADMKIVNAVVGEVLV